MENIRIMSQNLLGSDTEYPTHAKNPKFADRIKVNLDEHTMEKRLPRVIKLIEKYAPDSLGVQECCTTWRKLFANGSLDSIGYVRLGATKHPKSSIIYNAKKLEVIESESIWLTEKPEELSLSVEWRESPDDPLIERLAMYAVFEIRESGERYIHVNTHIDLPRNSIIQPKQTELLLSYIEKIRRTLEEVDQASFERAIERITSAKRIYILGVRSSSSLASFLNFNFQMIFDNVKFIQTTSGSEMFEQIMQIGEGDVMIAISFPRYSKRIINAVEYARSKKANVVALTDSKVAPIAAHADELLIAQSDMISFVDSLVAPLSIINAIVMAVSRKKQKEVTERLRILEEVWDRYEVYDKKRD